MRQYDQGYYRPRHPEKYVGNPNNIIYRSSWERIFCKWVDMNPAILSWSSEEICIPYIKPTDGAVHRYFPDYIIKVKDRTGKITTWMVEIKPYNQSVPPVPSKRKRQSTLLQEQATYLINQYKWKAAKEFCAKKGWVFKVITEKELGLV